LFADFNTIAKVQLLNWSHPLYKHQKKE